MNATETSISRERAQRILTAAGMADEYDPMGDYYIGTDADGTECLTVWGQDEPLTENHGSLSWLSN